MQLLILDFRNNHNSDTNIFFSKRSTRHIKKVHVSANIEFNHINLGVTSYEDKYVHVVNHKHTEHVLE